MCEAQGFYKSVEIPFLCRENCVFVHPVLTIVVPDMGPAPPKLRDAAAGVPLPSTPRAVTDVAAALDCEHTFIMGGG